MLLRPQAQFAGGNARPMQTSARHLGVRAGYDNARTTDENQRQWLMTDYLSAKAANSFQVRRTLRSRSRNEVANGPYLFGITNGNADDLISTGPTLQCLTSSEALNRQIEALWKEWWDEVDGVEKLRTCKLAKTVDGEGFLILKTVEDLEHPVKLYPVDIEADQVTTPAPKNLDELCVDGLTLHPVTGRPITYEVLRHHPGDLFFSDFNPTRVESIPRRHVIHWFNKFRPGQVRGVPIFTSSLDMFSDMRTFRKSVIGAAKIAAQFAAILLTKAPANVDDPDLEQTEPLDRFPIDMGTMTTLPADVTDMKQFDPKQPATTYEMFQEKTLGEACRPLSYPLNLALGSSQKFNFSSAKLDYVNYRGSLTIERGEANKVVLDRLFRAFIEELILLGLLPSNIRSVRDVPHEWHWPGFPPLDPIADAAADHDRLSAGTTTWRQFWAERGYDWRDMMKQQQIERVEIETLGLVFGDPVKRSVTETSNEPEAANAV